MKKIKENTVIDTLNVRKVDHSAIKLHDFSPAQPYLSFRNGNVTNLFSVIKDKNNASKKVNKITGNLTLSNSDLTVEIDCYKELLSQYNDSSNILKNSTHLLLDALISRLTNDGIKSTIVNLSFSDYMIMRDMKDKKTFRKQVAQDLNTLLSIKLTYIKEIKHKKKVGDNLCFSGMNIFQTCDLEANMIKVNFTQRFCEILKHYSVMLYPLALYRINLKKNPNSYNFGKYIFINKYRNTGKNNENFTKVLTLLQQSSDIIQYEDDKKHFGQRIVQPFIRDMNALSDMCTWNFCSPEGIDLTNEYAEKCRYNNFINLRIKVHIENYPDQTARLENKAKIIMKNMKKKK